MSIPELSVEVARERTADVEYKIAANFEERASAFRLVYESYLRAGLGEPNPCALRVTPYHLLPTTEVLIAVLRGETFFTMSLVMDGELGLPMEAVYGDEVAARRKQGRRIAEVSCLADRRKNFRGFFPVFLRLSRLTTQYAQREGMDELLIAVHPKHARFYQRLLNFEPIGQQRAYPSVRNRPAVALCLDFARLRREHPATYETLFGKPFPDKQLKPRPITTAERDFFRPMVDPSFDFAPMGEVDDLFAGGRLEPAPEVGAAAVNRTMGVSQATVYG